MDSALRWQFLAVLDSDFRIAEKFGVAGVGRTGWTIIKSNWEFNASVGRNLLQAALGGVNRGTRCFFDENAAIQPPEGGLLSCNCQCHVPIGSGIVMPLDSCVHCRLLA